MPRTRPILLAVLITFAACSDSSGPSAPSGLWVERASWGRLVDLYGWRSADGILAPELVESDVVVGPLAGEPGTDAPGFHRWLPRDPATHHERLLIDAPIGSEEFTELRGRIGRDLPALDSAPVARDAALVIELSAPHRLPADFFFSRGPDGVIHGPANVGAVQLLELDAPPPTAGTPRAVRIVASGTRIVIDPSLSKSESVHWNLPVRNGLRTPRADRAPDLRVAVALTGPFAIPGLTGQPPNGTTSDGHGAFVVDLRGAADDEDGVLLRAGHLPESIAPRLVADLPLIVAEVDPPRHGRQRLRVFKNGLVHELDAGDVLEPRALDGASLGLTEVIVDPAEDRGRPGEPFVDLLVRALPGLAELDPRARPDHPADPAALPAWLAQHGAHAVLSAGFDVRDIGGDADDLRNFIRFTPPAAPLADGSPSPPGQNLSPSVEALVHFDEPVDPHSLRGHDTFFFALRDLFDTDALIDELLVARGADPARVPVAKLVTPFLVASRIVDMHGDRTTFRLTPLLGLYLDERMRREDGPLPFEQQRFRYFVHLRSGEGGIRDRAGNPLILGGDTTPVVLPFALDLRRDARGPLQPDNLVAQVVRRFDHRDEDERPSILRDAEIPLSGAPTALDARPVDDWFGAHSVFDGILAARPTARVTRFVDDVNQPRPPEPGKTNAPHCPETIGTSEIFTIGSATIACQSPLANPLNPAGSRLQTVWREIDLGLSHEDPQDMDLHVEAMAWAPWGDGPTALDVLHGASLFLSHSEWRPEPCIGSFSCLPEMPYSGLRNHFSTNYAHDLDPRTGQPVPSTPHLGFENVDWVVDPAQAFTDPSGSYRYLPMPEFEEPYLVWRDQILEVQGGNAWRGSDVRNANRNMLPYIMSPFAGGLGRLVRGAAASPEYVDGHWINTQQFRFDSITQLDPVTGGGVGPIALPLLADLWIDGHANTGGAVDDPPVGGGPLGESQSGGPECGGQYRGPPDVAFGTYGWATSLAMATSPQPNFRAYSGGFAGTPARPAIRIGPGHQEWDTAAGGYTPAGSRTGNTGDNTSFWTAITFLKRRTVSTSGFIDVLDPHRADRSVLDDPRLFRLDGPTLPPGHHLNVISAVERTPDGGRDTGTVTVDYRATSEVSPEPWIWTEQQWPRDLKPDADNFPLDPRKAGDAWLRKHDTRPNPTGEARGDWLYPYNRFVTPYFDDPSRLHDGAWLAQQIGPSGRFLPDDVRYLGWRLVMENGADTAPGLETFALAYRIERTR